MNSLVLMQTFWQSLGDFGNTIMEPLYWAVSGIIVFFHNVWGPVFGPDSGWGWTLSIISLTIVVRLAMLPLFVKQINSSRALQSVQPKMKALQQKYGHDQVRLGQETQKLYKEEGVNPAASCGPLLIQMPIFLALFQVLNGASLGQTRGFWLVSNPELVDSLKNSTIFGAKLAGRFLPMNDGFGATQVLCLILVILMTGALLFQQLQMLRHNMPPESLEGPMGQQQKMMVYLFPFIYAITGISIPIGVLIYWLTTNLWTMAQQFVIIHTYPTPNTPAFVEWEERMRAQGKDPDAIEAARIAKLRRTPKSTPAPVVAEGEKPTVARQKAVTRTTTIRRDADGRQVIPRSQPSRQSRSGRKK